MMELVRWVIFGVIFALLPVAFKFVSGISRKTEEVTFVWLFEHGELLLISTVIAAGALGRVFGAKTTHPYLELISGAGCLWLLLISSYWFADISVSKSGANINTKITSYGSAILFTVNILASGCCVYCVI
jgi:hypothetical protein